MSQVITRFAPSPTGRLHVGGARTALFCWALAKKLDGRFMIRIEDTDRARSSGAATEAILDDLAWLGLDWDDGPELTAPDGRAFGGDDRGVGPFEQSARTEIYNQRFEQLLGSGAAYPAFETGEELDALRAEAQAQKKTFRYQRAAGYDHAAAVERMRAGEPHVLRLHVPQASIEVNDEVRGTIEFTPEHYDDFIIRKRDGMPTYHFAVVVDDELMGVTHVLRGEEHLNNTPKHVALQHALGYRTPVYAHLSVIANPDGSKMSKRDKDKAARKACKEMGVTEAPGDAVAYARFNEWLDDKSKQLEPDELFEVALELGMTLPEIEVGDFRASGYLPGALCNYLALLGWNPGVRNEEGEEIDRFDMAFLAQHFAPDRLIKKAASFDRAKLAAFNQDAIAAMAPHTFAAAWRGWAQQHEPTLIWALGDRFDLAAAAAQPRAKTLSSASDAILFALRADDAVEFDAKAVKKVLAKNDGKGLATLAELKGVIEAIDPFEAETIESALREWAESKGLGMGGVAQPLRVAITGVGVSPGLGETLALVGRDGVLRRVERCLDVCGAMVQNAD